MLPDRFISIEYDFDLLHKRVTGTKGYLPQCFDNQLNIIGVFGQHSGETDYI